MKSPFSAGRERCCWLRFFTAGLSARSFRKREQRPSLLKAGGRGRGGRAGLRSNRPAFMTNGLMHFFYKVSLKGELLCVRITITLSNVCVSDSGREALPEGTRSMHLPPSGAIQGTSWALSWESIIAKLHVGPAAMDPPGPHECSELIADE